MNSRRLIRSLRQRARIAEYKSGPYAGIAEKALKGLAGLEPADADPSDVARQIVRVVDPRSASAPTSFRRRTTRRSSTRSAIACGARCIALGPTMRYFLGMAE
jgi:hypothetical protein